MMSGVIVKLLVVNLKAHYSVYKGPPIRSIPDQMKPIYNTSCDVFNVILPSTPCNRTLLEQFGSPSPLLYI